MFGRWLCNLGLHRYEWRGRTETDPDTKMQVLKDEYRCKRKGCPQSHFWHVANVDKVRQPW